MTQPEDQLTAPADFAVAAAMRLQKEHTEAIANGTIDLTKDQEIMQLESAGRKNRSGEGSKLRTKGSIMDRIRFGWRPEDKLVMEQIKSGAEAAYDDLYRETFGVIDDFYEVVRVPRMHNGHVIKDHNGRTVWEVDQYGNIVQDYSKLTGQDIDTALFKLQEIKFYIAPKLNELLLGAIYAKHLYDDAHADAYSSVVEGTVGDREARASRDARQDKYAAFFRFWIYSQGDTFMKELNSLQRLLDRTRDAHIRSGRG